MGTRTVAYEGGLIVLFRAVMDNALGAYLKARLPSSATFPFLPLLMTRKLNVCALPPAFAPLHDLLHPMCLHAASCPAGAKQARPVIGCMHAHRT